MSNDKLVRGAAAAVGAAGGLVAGGPAGAAMGGVAAERLAKTWLDRHPDEADENAAPDGEDDPDVDL